MGDERVQERGGRLFRLLLWDYGRGSLAYDLAFFVVVLLILLVPGSFWGDPLWPR